MSAKYPLIFLRRKIHHSEYHFSYDEIEVTLIIKYDSEKRDYWKSEVEVKTTIAESIVRMEKQNSFFRRSNDRIWC